jgi:ankyrin repeat protein
MTALMLCCKEGYEELACLLLKAGAKTEGNFSTTPIQLAQMNGHANLVLIMTNSFNVPLHKRPGSNRLVKQISVQSKK